MILMGSQRTARLGDTVHVHFVSTLDDGRIVGESQEGAPLSFVVGSGRMGDAFDRVVDGLNVGELRTIRIEAADAHGERDESLVMRVAAGDLPDGLRVGDRIAFQGAIRRRHGGHE